MSHTSFRVQIYIKKTKYTSLWSTNLCTTATIFRFILLGDQWNRLMIHLKKSPTARSRAVRPIGYFAVLQDAEQVPVPARAGDYGL